MLKGMFPAEAYHNRQFVTLTNVSGPNEGEVIGSVYNSAGKKLNVNTQSITAAKWFYEDSGLVSLGSAQVEDTKAYFKVITVNGTKRYTDTVWYSRASIPLPVAVRQGITCLKPGYIRR